jgi:hypothetical protein
MFTRYEQLPNIQDDIADTGPSSPPGSNRIEDFTCNIDGRKVILV